ncbi:MAG: hypothetical protein J3K34DRAFT_479228 [Monoraphidium minutum]|nr:MAG: hypothetical protein J3K34DRAFT_479228 [Monoraphidium minutum]
MGACVSSVSSDDDLEALYELVRVLRLGGGGRQVWLARCRRTGCCVTVQLIPRGPGASPGSNSKELRRELQLQARLSHVNVAELRQLALTPRHLALVASHEAGGDLETFCARFALDEVAARYFFRQVVSAVDYLHRQRVAPRGLRLSSFLLTAQVGAGAGGGIGRRADREEARSSVGRGRGRARISVVAAAEGRTARRAGRHAPRRLTARAAPRRAAQDPPRIRLGEGSAAAPWAAQAPSIDRLHRLAARASPSVSAAEAPGGPQASEQPSLAAADGSRSPQEDVWAAGLLLCQMLFGRAAPTGLRPDPAAPRGARGGWAPGELRRRAGALSAPLRDLLDEIFVDHADERITIRVRVVITLRLLCDYYAPRRAAAGVMRHPWYVAPLPPRLQAALEEMEAEQALRERMERATAAGGPQRRADGDGILVIDMAHAAANALGGAAVAPSRGAAAAAGLPAAPPPPGGGPRWDGFSFAEERSRSGRAGSSGGGGGGSSGCGGGGASWRDALRAAVGSGGRGAAAADAPRGLALQRHPSGLAVVSYASSDPFVAARDPSLIGSVARRGSGAGLAAPLAAGARAATEGALPRGGGGGGGGAPARGGGGEPGAWGDGGGAAETARPHGWGSMTAGLAPDLGPIRGPLVRPATKGWVSAFGPNSAFRQRGGAPGGSPRGADAGGAAAAPGGSGSGRRPSAGGACGSASELSLLGGGGGGGGGDRSTCSLGMSGCGDSSDGRNGSHPGGGSHPGSGGLPPPALARARAAAARLRRTSSCKAPARRSPALLTGGRPQAPPAVFLFTLTCAFRRGRHGVRWVRFGRGAHISAAAAPNGFGTDGYPLTTLATVTLSSTVAAGVPYNTYVNQQAVVNAFNDEASGVPTPNGDTLYSTSWLDLSLGPLLLGAGDSGGRFWTLPLSDMYTNVYATIGFDCTGSGAAYTCDSDVPAAQVLLLPPGYKPRRLPRKMGARIINSTTEGVWVIGRTAVQADNATDAAAAVQFQSTYTITAVTAKGQRRNASYVRDMCGVAAARLAVYGADKAEPNALYDAIAGLAKSFPPPKDQKRNTTLMFKSMGLSLGRGFKQAKASAGDKGLMAEGIALGAACISSYSASGDLGVDFPNGWSFSNKNGLFGTVGGGAWMGGRLFLLRAAVAQQGLGALPPQVAIYITNKVDASGTLLSGAGNASYTVTFDTPPPAAYFWSLSMYDTSTYLFVQNPINRTEVSSTTPGLNYTPGGALPVDMAAGPPANATSWQAANWLPAANGTFYVVLRLYGPGNGVAEGLYMPPSIVKNG